MPSNPAESEAASNSPPPEAVLVRRAREASGLGYDAAADKLKIRLTGRRWRQLEEGREHSGGKAATMSDVVLAHMAYVVNVSPEQLEGVGRAESAEILREIQRQDQQRAEGSRLTTEVPTDELERLLKAAEALQRRVENQPAPETRPGSGASKRDESAR
jgi:hypothetical protein